MTKCKERKKKLKNEQIEETQQKLIIINANFNVNKFAYRKMEKTTELG